MARHRIMGLLQLLLAVVLLVAPARSESKCLCQVSSCLCCVELNLTSSIDLGGPACVNVRQIERNVSLNLSYGDNPVHNATIALEKAADKPTCMNLLSDLAQICAKFVAMKAPPQDEQGYDGCLVIEPALLGAPQATYPVGCFRLGHGQVRQIESMKITINEKVGQKQGQNADQEQEEEEDDDQGLNAEELIAAVSASAEQGIAFFSQLLGFNLTPKTTVNVTSESNTENASHKPERPSRKANAAPDNRHGRFIASFMSSEDRNDEKFKQLLSAQDNILKESVFVGEPSRNLATDFFYPQPQDDPTVRLQNLEMLTTITSDNLPVVPTASRRGGRAYSIHQHVNEV